MGWLLEVGVVERGVGVLNVVWPDVFSVAVDGVLTCVAGPHKLLGVEDNGLELIRGLLWNRVSDRLPGGLEPQAALDRGGWRMGVPFLVGEVVVDGGIAVIGDELHVGGEATSSCGVVVVGEGGLFIVGLVVGHFVIIGMVVVGVVYR